ncbi:hypothetical protein [uncultured Arcobacter sp.]|uniref:hypothetical protein n=1 Tax=uncultured Arcobacter sp. TaxID=165434 RepID=UPI0026385301|nr:hypothetical protein [uncultured Arcobacter sp.]
MFNYTSDNKFKLIFAHNDFFNSAFEFNLQDLTFPDITIGVAEQPTPMKTLYHSGDSVEISDMSFTILIDEEYDSYVNILNWMFGAVNYKDSTTKNVFSDATLMIMSNKGNVLKTFKLYDIFPYNVSPPALTYVSDEDNVLVFTALFKVNGISIT